MKLSGSVPVCLHCGEMGSEGALFCGKCGYTLPQTEAGAPAGAYSGRLPPASPVPPAPPTIASGGWGPVVPPGAYAAPTDAVPGAVGAIPPPPFAKYCVRCAALISSPAVYCPVCQQPQP